MENSFFETNLNVALQQIKNEEIIRLQYFSFVQAVLLIHGEKNLIFPQEYLILQLQKIYKEQPTRIDNICSFLEEFALRNTVYKQDVTGLAYTIARFEKFNPKKGFWDICGLNPADTPLYMHYSSYYFTKKDVYDCLNRIHNILDNSFFVANGYTTEALKFLYAFSEYCTNPYTFADSKEMARIDDIKSFAKKLNLDVSQKVIEAVDTMLSTQQLKTRPGRKSQNKPLKHKK